MARGGALVEMSGPKVAHLVYDLIRGGTEGQCARIAMGMAKQGLPHRVAVFRRRGFFLDAVEAACGPVHEMAIRHLVRPATVREVRRLAEWLRRERADILHAWDADAAIFGQFAAQRAGVKLITSRRDLGQIYAPHKAWLMRRADRLAVRVVANAEAVREHFISQGLPASKMDVLPNLLDVEERDRLATMPCACADRLLPGRRLVVVNRLDPEKNTGLLVEALPRVKQAIPEAVLIVVGDGREMPLLREKAAALGVADAVCFLGEVMEVPALLRFCEAGALVPNSNEGLSNTILEYMAAGLPTLATDCGGNRELVRNGETGRLVPSTASAVEVAEAWISLLQDREGAAAMGRQARTFVLERHVPEIVLAQFRGLYERIAGGPAGGAGA
jgi:glycosyltransferase involved in cell wall biosynthesis